MKIFLDTADVKKIEELSHTGLIDGVTTNPTHLAQEKKDPVDVIKKIIKLLPDGLISVEVTKEKPDHVYQQAKEIAALSQNILVKVPCHRIYYPVIKKLVSEGVHLNITLVFSLIQSLAMCKLGVAYISPFVGRWDDIDVQGTALLEELRFMVDEYAYDTQILAASLRTVRHIHDAILSGVDAITVPVELFEKSLEHPLTDRGIEKFLIDWKKLNITQFP